MALDGHIELHQHNGQARQYSDAPKNAGRPCIRTCAASIALICIRMQSVGILSKLCHVVNIIRPSQAVVWLSFSSAGLHKTQVAHTHDI